MSLLSLAKNAMSEHLSSAESKTSVIQPILASESNRAKFINQFVDLPRKKKINFINQYSNALWVYVCIDKIAKSAARVPAKVFYRRSNNGTKGLTKKEYELITKRHKINLRPYDTKMECYFPTRELSKFPIELLYKMDNVSSAPDSPLQKLLDKPNPFFEKFYLMEGSITYLELRGNSFLNLVGEKSGPITPENPPVELWHLNPDQIVIVPDKRKFIKAYVYDLNNERVVIRPENVIQFKYFNPLSLYYGQGTVEALVDTIKLEKNSVDYQNKFYQQGMRPSSIFKTPDSLSGHQFDRLLDQIESNYSGLTNMHRPLLLEGGMEWQSMSISQKDAELFSLRKMSREDFLAAFGVPPIIVGIEGENLATARESRQVFYFDTIMPKVRLHEDTINSRLASLFGDDFFVKYDFSDTPAGSVDRKELTEGLRRAFTHGALSRNEYRLNLEKLNIELSDINLGDDGDTFYMATNLILTDTDVESGSEVEDPVSTGEDEGEPDDDDSEDDKPKPKKPKIPVKPIKPSKPKPGQAEGVET